MRTLSGVLGDKLNAMLSALGFNLVKLMKALRKRWIKGLFLHPYAMMQRILSWMREIGDSLLLLNRFYWQTRFMPAWLKESFA